MLTIDFLFILRKSVNYIMLIFFNRNMNTASVNRVLSEMINCYGPMGMTNFALRRPVESKPLDQSKIDTIDYIAEVCPFAKFGKKNRFGGASGKHIKQTIILSVYTVFHIEETGT